MQLVQLIIKMNSECRDVVFFIGLSLILAGHFVHSLFFFSELSKTSFVSEFSKINRWTFQFWWFEHLPAWAEFNVAGKQMLYIVAKYKGLCAKSIFLACIDLVLCCMHPKIQCPFWRNEGGHCQQGASPRSLAGSVPTYIAEVNTHGSNLCDSIGRLSPIGMNSCFWRKVSADTLASAC